MSNSKFGEEALKAIADSFIKPDGTLEDILDIKKHVPVIPIVIHGGDPLSGVTSNDQDEIQCGHTQS